MRFMTRQGEIDQTSYSTRITTDIKNEHKINGKTDGNDKNDHYLKHDSSVGNNSHESN